MGGGSGGDCICFLMMDDTFEKMGMDGWVMRGCVVYEYIPPFCSLFSFRSQPGVSSFCECMSLGISFSFFTFLISYLGWGFGWVWDGEVYLKLFSIFSFFIFSVPIDLIVQSMIQLLHFLSGFFSDV